MFASEYIKTIVYNGHMINVGMDTGHHQFYIEYLDKEGKLTRAECGAYKLNYNETIEHLFGAPAMCVQYGKHVNDHTTCEHQHAHGYCGRCEYNSKNRGMKQ